jgi:sec-independent protein translocase protein TatA
MLGLDNPIHIAFLLILLLLVFGAKRLPEMGRSLGSGMRGFRDSLSGEHLQPPASVSQPAPAPAAVTTATVPVVAPVATPAPVAAQASAVPQAPADAPGGAAVEVPGAASIQQPTAPFAA